ncbi:MAG: DUF5711 family protein [Clostridia bacterium]|nr:DUF5711 family protein [Clostridia bacterium]
MSAVEKEEAGKKIELPESSRYYFRIAKRYRVVMTILLIVMAVFIVAMFSVYREEITVENLKYFLRYIDTRQAEKSATTDVLVYDEIESIIQFGVYKNGLAVVGYDQIQLYDLTGEAILNLNQVNSSPNFLSGDRYMMVYNIGGNTFQVYNSLTKVYEENYDYGIGVAAMGDSGTFLVTTRSMEYRSVVNVYDKDFNMIYRWYSPDKLVMDAAFRQGDSEFLLATLGTHASGVNYAEIILCETGKEEKRAQFQIDDEVIYRAHYSEDGGFVLVGGKAIYYYDKNCALISTLSYGGYTPANVDTEAGLTYFTLNKNIVGSNYELTVTDGVGTVLYTGTVSGEITKVMPLGNAIYILLDRSLLRISLETGQQIEEPIDTNCISVLSLDARTLLLCYAGETHVIDIDSFFFHDSDAASGNVSA